MPDQASSDRPGVRDAKPDDAEAIAEVHIRTWQVAYAHAFPSAALRALVAETPQRTRFWRETIESLPSGRRVVVGEGDRGVVGFAAMGPAEDPELDPERTAELYSIYVLPESWGQGSGQELMVEALDWLRGAGFDDAILWVLEDNPRTRRFYELAGWKLDGAAKEDTYLDTPVQVVRYRIEL